MSLLDITVKKIVNNFPNNTEIPVETPVHIKNLIYDKLPTSLKFTKAAAAIDNENYWKRCLEEKYPTCEISEHNYNYKQAYIELFISEKIDEIVPILNDQTQRENKYDDSTFQEKTQAIRSYLKICSKFIFFLTFRSLRTKLTDFSDRLPFLVELKVSYDGQVNELSKYKLSKEMKPWHALDLSNFLETSNIIKLELQRNNIDDNMLKPLVDGLRLNSSLCYLDLSHNKIEDNGARRLAKWLMDSATVVHLNLWDNLIHSEGCLILFNTLKRHPSLEWFEIGLNVLRDDCGIKALGDLKNNISLKYLGLSGNSLADGFASELEMFLDENKVLNEIDISCNQIGIDKINDLKKIVLENERFHSFLVHGNEEVTDGLVQALNTHCRKNKENSQIIVPEVELVKD